MMSKVENPAAFPAVGEVYGMKGDTRWAPGMSLRDYFAGQALAGMLACTDTEDATPDGAAKWAYRYADAMLTARTKEPTP
jgi:hypothetical protein